jgi:6-pyruvoyltetrahydropterin/6-carboxytetrahydropterin synthase
MVTYLYIDGWKANIRFSAAHVIHDYEKCGRLHGHTYAVHIKIDGIPDEKGIIMDFSLMKNILRETVDVLDHKILIPENNSKLYLKKEKGKLILVAQSKEYVFPLSDCIFLPIESTTAENLASYIINKVSDKFNFSDRIKKIEIGIDEGFGQGAKIIKKIND